MEMGVMRDGTNLKNRFLSRYHRRRGLATVVTGAIMLSAVAILGTSTVSWSNSYLVTHQETLERSYSEKTNKISEFITIENVWAGQTITEKYLNVTLTNTGNIGVTITEIKIVGTTQHVEPVTNGEIVPGGVYSTIINYEWNNNDAIDIFVTTARDSIFRTQILAQ